MLPDRSFLMGQKWLENVKIEKLKCDIFGDFQALCRMMKIADNLGAETVKNYRTNKKLHLKNLQIFNFN